MRDALGGPGEVPDSFTVLVAPGPCLACDFSVDALMEAIYDGSFPLCRAHMLRAHVVSEEIVGGEYLRPV